MGSSCKNAPINFDLPVRNGEALKGFSLNLILGTSNKMFLHMSVVINIGQQ